MAKEISFIHNGKEIYFNIPFINASLKDLYKKIAKSTQGKEYEIMENGGNFWEAKKRIKEDLFLIKSFIKDYSDELDFHSEAINQKMKKGKNGKKSSKK